jgi:hypothetical protein
VDCETGLGARSEAEAEVRLKEVRLRESEDPFE